MNSKGLYIGARSTVRKPNASPPRNCICITSGRLFLFLMDHLYLGGHAFPTSSHADTVSDSAVQAHSNLTHVGAYE